MDVMRPINQPIRVLQIVSGIDIGRLSGGAEYFALRLAMSLDVANFRSAVFSLSTNNGASEINWRDQLERQQITLYDSESDDGSTLSRIARLYKSYQKCLDSFCPDIVTSHSERADLLNIAGKKYHPTHPRSVRTVHIDQQWKTRPRFGALFENLFAPLAFDKEVAVSATIQAIMHRRWLARLLHKDAQIFYNGIDKALFTFPNEPSPLPLGIPYQRPRIICVGRLTEQKGQRYLIGAMQAVIRRQPAHLLLIGAGPLEGELLQLVETLHLEEHVHFLGWRNDVVDILPHIDLFVSASLWEGLPTVLLEAMAKRVPVVATRVSGSQELVVDMQTGILVDPNNEEALENAICWALDHPVQIRRFAQNAYERAQKFTFDNTVAQFSDLYSHLA